VSNSVNREAPTSPAGREVVTQKQRELLYMDAFGYTVCAHGVYVVSEICGNCRAEAIAELEVDCFLTVHERQCE
jgi:hypothetical protein